MITLNNNEANTIITYYDAPEQYFLFEFKSGVNCQPIYLLPENISACDDYQKFIINRNFGFGGVWTVNIYNQINPTNTNPANATLLATEQVTIVIDDDCFNTPPVIIDPCPQINPADFSCEELLTPYTGLTETQIECILATLSCEYLREVLTYEQIECFGPPLSGYTCEQLLEGLTESQLSCLLRSFDCEFLNDPYLGLTRNQLACLPGKPIDLHTCEELLDPYTGLTNEQKACVLQDLTCEFLNTNLTEEQKDCVGKPIQDYTCEQLIDPYTGLTDSQKICVLQELPCSLVADEYNGLTDEQKACVIPTLSCDILEANLTQEQIDCLVQLGYDVDYRAVLSYATAQSYTQPSNFQKILQSDLMTNLKLAADALNDYKLIRVYGNDIVHGTVPIDLGFDGINWAEPGTLTPTRVNTVVKTTNQGYASNGVDARIREGFNPSTGGIPSNDFLWFTCYWYNNTGGGGSNVESVFNSSFTQRIDKFYLANPISVQIQYMFGISNPVQSFPSANTQPTFQTHIQWRDGNNMYIMINGVQYGPFTSGSDTGLMNQEFNSLVRSYETNNFFDFMDTAIRKTVFGFAQASKINKSLLHAALFNYHVNL